TRLTDRTQCRQESQSDRERHPTLHSCHCCLTSFHPTQAVGPPSRCCVSRRSSRPSPRRQHEGWRLMANTSPVFGPESESRDVSYALKPTISPSSSSTRADGFARRRLSKPGSTAS